MVYQQPNQLLSLQMQGMRYVQVARTSWIAAPTPGWATESTTPTAAAAKSPTTAGATSRHAPGPPASGMAHVPIAATYSSAADQLLERPCLRHPV